MVKYMCPLCIVFLKPSGCVGTIVPVPVPAACSYILNIAVLCCWALVTFIYHVFSLQAHYIKATAFRGAGRSEEALQEYFFCVALKSDWIAVKLEAQEVH